MRLALLQRRAVRLVHEPNMGLLSEYVCLWKEWRREEPDVEMCLLVTATAELSNSMLHSSLSLAPAVYMSYNEEPIMHP